MRLISCRLRPTDATKPIRPPTHSPPEALPVVVGISLHPKQPQALCHPLWGPTAGRHPPPPSLLTWRGGEDSSEPVKASRRTRKRKGDGGYVPTRTTYQPDVDNGPDTLGGVESAQKEVPPSKILRSKVSTSGPPSDKSPASSCQLPGSLAAHPPFIFERRRWYMVPSNPRPVHGPPPRPCPDLPAFPS